MANIFKTMISSIIAKNIKRKLTNWTITEEDITDVLKQIRIALLDADVNLLVVKNFIKSIRDKTVGYVLEKGQEPDKVLLNIVKQELVNILGKQKKEINIDKNPTKIMIVGLNGSGKTTSIAKLAKYLKLKKNKKPMLVALDVYRPAAIEQLNQLADKINIPCYKQKNCNDVIDISKNGFKKALEQQNDVILFDTAGRLQTNIELMEELKNIKKVIHPDEILLVVDAMSGQDIVNVAKEFNDYLNLTGLIITKLDSDARAGAVLSIISMLNLPVLFTGDGESLDALNIFYPERIADKILGLGDIVTLAEKAIEKVDQSTTKKSFSRMLSGKFDLEDLLRLTKQISNLGSLGGILKMLPNQFSQKINDNQIENAENKIKIWNVLISSMTKLERRNPNLFKKNVNRKNRVIKGSGKKIDDLNKMLAQWAEMKSKLDQIAKKIKSGGNPLSSLLNGGLNGL